MPQVMKGETARCSNLCFQQSFGASGPRFHCKHVHNYFFCLVHYDLRLVAGCIGVYIATTLLTVHIVISPCVTSTTYPLALYVSPAIPLWGQSKSLVRVNQVLSSSLSESKSSD